MEMITHLFEWIPRLMDFILHLNQHLNFIIENYGLWCYLIFFLIIFAETGLVVTPFLPGDSFLFALGAIAAAGSLKVGAIFIVLAIAAILGNGANYAVGKYFGDVILNARVNGASKKSMLTAHMASTKNTAQKPSSWPDSSQSSEPSPHS